jgi:hypothetical protein
MKIITILMIALVTGCSAFRPHSQTVNVNCTPNGKLMVNGSFYKSPSQIEVPRNRDLTVQCHKKGYYPAQRTIGNHLNMTGALDGAGTLILLWPGIGLLTPGAWSLDQTDVQVQLFKED